MVGAGSRFAGKFSREFPTKPPLLQSPLYLEGVGGGCYGIGCRAFLQHPLTPLHPGVCTRNADKHRCLTTLHPLRQFFSINNTEDISPIELREKRAQKHQRNGGNYKKEKKFETVPRFETTYCYLCRQKRNLMTEYLPLKITRKFRMG